MSRSLLAALGCALLSTAAAANGARTIRVSNVEQLYAAVNGAHNDNARIELAPGRYVLSESGRPNQGRLTLRQGMSLIGADSFLTDLLGLPVPRDGKNGEVYALAKTETIIDGSGLLGDDTSGAGSRGVIESGLANRIEGLTVLGNEEVTAAITVNLYPADGRDGMSVEISGCDLQGGRRGIQLGTGGGTTGLTSTFLLSGNVLRHNRGPFGFGVQLLQFGAKDETLLANLLSNRFYDNWTGLFLPMLGSSHSETYVVSIGNAYQFNAVGLEVIGSRDFGLPFGQPLPPGTPFPDASYDRTSFESWGDLIANNTDVPDDGGGTGVWAVGASRDCPPPGAGDSCYLSGTLGPNGGDISHTTVELAFHGARFVQGHGDQNGAPGSTIDQIPARSDMQIFGEFSDYGSLAGTSNVVTVTIEGSVSDGAATALEYDNTDPDVTDASGTDRVVWRERANTGVPKPMLYPF